VKVPPAIARALPTERDPTIVYDGECPFCSAYVRYYRLQQAVGDLTLIDARSNPDLISAFRASGLNLNDGMAFILGGQLHHGAEAVHVMALMSSPSGLFNRVNAQIFRSSWIARGVYPTLRFGRNAILGLLRRRPL
jgi:predicted DCC family thiol-disulfide oxidoreductase YuxK